MRLQPYTCSFLIRLLLSHYTGIPSSGLATDYRGKSYSQVRSIYIPLSLVLNATPDSFADCSRDLFYCCSIQSQAVHEAEDHAELPGQTGTADSL